MLALLIHSEDPILIHKLFIVTKIVKQQFVTEQMKDFAETWTEAFLCLPFVDVFLLIAFSYKQMNKV